MPIVDRQADGVRRRGALAAELAILLPFVSIMFLIALDFCRLFYCSQTVQNCAECAALYASGTTAAPATSTLTPSLLQTVVNLLLGGGSQSPNSAANQSAYQAAL